MKLRHMSVGANYHGPRRLRFAEADALAFHEAIRTQTQFSSRDGALAGCPCDARTVLDALREQASASGPTDCLIFFFAGHGIVEEDASGVDQLYLVCDQTRPEAVEETAVRLDLVTAVLERSRANVAVALLDCCFSGYEGRSLLGPKTLHKLQTGRSVAAPPPVIGGFGRLVISACGRSETAAERESLGHGVFTSAVLHCLTAVDGARSVSIASFYSAVQAMTRHLSNGRQCPNLYGGDHGAYLPTVRAQG